MNEQELSPDSDTRDFADIYRPNGFIIIHSQYIRGRENEIIQEDPKRDLPELRPLRNNG